jgi:MoaA/NifB/PqqE/SkfB family radical SAM enzyme
MHMAISPPAGKTLTPRELALAGQPLPLPRELYIESTSRCNETCDQCPRTHLGREPDRDITLAEVRHIVEQLPVIERVVLHGLGEPLMNVELPQIVAYLHGRGAYTLFNSNALLLNDARGRALIEAGLDELRVSVDGATPATYARIRGVNQRALPHIIRNLTAFAELKRELGVTKPRTSIWFTAMRENIGELPQLVDIATQTGVPEVYVQRFIYFGKGLAQEEQAIFHHAQLRERKLIAEAGARCQALGIRFTATGATTPATYLSRPSRRGAEQSDPARPWAGCHRPYTLAYITAHGSVYSCCFAPFHPGPWQERKLGDAFSQSLAEIWNGQRYAAFRAAFASDTPWSQCAGCGTKWSL